MYRGIGASDPNDFSRGVIQNMSTFKFAQRVLHATWIRPSRLTALLTLGFIALQSTTLAAQAMTRQTAIQLAMVSAVPLPRTSGNHLEDGIHFFGEASEREKLGSTYMIFEVKDSEVLGAVYSPHSAYSCFEGRFSNNQLALRVDDPYGDDVYLHEIALEQTALIAASSDLASVDLQIGLEGMIPLDNIQEQEQGLLASCQADV